MYLLFGALGSHNTPGDMVPDDLTESNCQLVTNQAKYFYFKVKDWDTFRSYVKNPENTIVEQVGNEIKKVVDTFVLTFHADVGAGNRVGTDLVGADVSGGAVTVTRNYRNPVLFCQVQVFSCPRYGWKSIQSSWSYKVVQN